MAVSTLKFVAERARQKLAKDTNFFKKLTYYFELEVPQEMAMGAMAKFFFPLIIPPESYTLDEPFTLEATPTQDGGLYVEENGIVQRMIKLEGSTGFAPRYFPKGTTPVGILTPDKRSHSRSLPVYNVVEKLSGHRHFQYLQDAVFRTYADLKRDPATSEDTKLFFHNTKDDEHWLIAPQKFTLTRTVDKRTLYRYSIDLLVLDKAEDAKKNFSEDKSLLDKIKDAFAMLKSGLDLAAGAVNDVTALTANLKNLVKDFGKLMDGVTTILDAVDNFVHGVTDLVEAPYALLESVIGMIDVVGEIAQSVEDLGTVITEIPENTIQKFKQMGDGLERIGSHPEVFTPPAIERIRSYKKRQELRDSSSPASIKEAEATAPPTTFTGVKRLGTTITQGDAISSKSELGINKGIVQYTSAKEYPIGQGDTLVNLAAKYLGDARRWQQIATLNGLQPPFINDLASTPLDTDDPIFSGVLGRGAKILIPSFAKAPEKQPLLPVLGVKNEENAETHLLGKDIALEIVGGREGAPLYDMAIDATRGSVDVKKVSGVQNISQAVRNRLLTERGSDILHKQLGLDRMISLNVTAVDLQIAEFRFRECLLQDPRIAGIHRMDFDAGVDPAPVDSVVIDAELELKGFSQSYTVQSPIGV